MNTKVGYLTNTPGFDFSNRIFRWIPAFVFCTCFLFLLSGCVTTPPPIDEYALARSALDAAKLVEAAKYSPGFWHTADDAYRRAKILYDEREYEDAEQLFEEARINAEKAENAARLVRQKNGEVL